jgi:PAS domain S-box-containing protein
VQYRVVRPDGSVRWIRDRSFPVKDSSGRVYRVAGIAEDITDRKAAEEALRESEGRFRQVVESIPQLVWVNLADGTVEYLNHRCLDYFGVPPEAMFGWDWRQAVHPDDLPRTLKAVEHTMQTAEPLRVEYRLRRADGQYRWHIGWAWPLKDSEGHIVKWFGTATDIHDRKQAEEALRQGQKMEAIGRLAGGIAHDFNNLLSIITGCGDAVLAGLRADDPARELLGHIKDAARRAASLTQQLLSFGRKTILEPRILDVNAQVLEIEPLLRRLLGEDIDLSSALAPELAPVWADPGQLQQAIINLAVNARDAMPQGGVLSIRTRNVKLDENYTALHAEVGPGPHVLLEVSDSGCGMSEEVKARLFEPFFTTKEQGKGTGLGLALVYGFVRQSKGHVTVESQPGQGTTFRIYLPPSEAVSGGQREPPTG